MSSSQLPCDSSLRRLIRFVCMTKRVAESAAPSSEGRRTGQNFFRYYRAQVEELLSQEEKTLEPKLGDSQKYSSETIGAEFSDLKKEKLNVLLRQCLCDSLPEVDELQSRVESMQRMSQLSNKKPSTSPANSESVIPEDPRIKEVEDDIQFLMKSDPELVKEIVNKHSSDLTARLNDMQQQLEKMLDSVVTTCRPMTHEEKQGLMKSIRELPRKNLERVVKIFRNRYAALGKKMPDEVVIKLEMEDNTMLWRLYYCVAAVKSARELRS